MNSRETRSSSQRQTQARERRARRAQILRDRRARSQARGQSDLNIVQQHFNQMRNRTPRTPESVHLSDNEEESDIEDSPRFGVQDFDSPSISYPLHAYEFAHTELTHENNPICPHCTSQLWKEESLNCCNKGKYAIPRLRSVPGDLRYSKTHMDATQRQKHPYNSRKSIPPSV